MIRLVFEALGGGYESLCLVRSTSWRRLETSPPRMDISRAVHLNCRCWRALHEWTCSRHEQKPSRRGSSLATISALERSPSRSRYSQLESPEDSLVKRTHAAPDWMHTRSMSTLALSAIKALFLKPTISVAFADLQNRFGQLRAPTLNVE